MNLNRGWISKTICGIEHILCMCVSSALFSCRIEATAAGLFFMKSGGILLKMYFPV
jgi:hypothetical protein